MRRVGVPVKLFKVNLNHSMFLLEKQTKMAREKYPVEESAELKNRI